MDAVIAATGLRPETALARRAGLTINRGVCVDSYLQTSNTDIYALGDCAEINGQVLPFLQPIQLSAMVLAKNLLGNNTPLKLPAMLVKIKTPELPLHLAGETQRQDLRWQINTERQGMVARGVDDADQLRATASGCHRHLNRPDADSTPLVHRAPGRRYFSDPRRDTAQAEHF